MNTKKIDSLQGLRLFAFFTIFMLHAGLSDTGEIGVSLFLILSGFVLFYNYGEKELDTSFKSSFSFSLKRIKKLYPLHIITMLIPLIYVAVELIKGFNSKLLLRTIGEIFLNVFLLQAWAPEESLYFSLNGLSWYLSVCLFIYLMFPLLKKLIGKYKSAKNAIVAILITLACMGLLSIVAAYINVPATISGNFPKWFTYICPLFRLGDFFVGCNLSYIFRKKNFNPSVLTATVFEVLAIALMVLMFFMRRFGILYMGAYFMRYNLVYIPASIAIVFSFALNKGLISRFLSLKPLVFLGELTGNAFLIHYVVIRVFLTATASISINVWVYTITCLTITFLLSYIYNLAIKKRP